MIVYFFVYRGHAHSIPIPKALNMIRYGFFAFFYSHSLFEFGFGWRKKEGGGDRERIKRAARISELNAEDFAGGFGRTRD